MKQHPEACIECGTCIKVCPVEMVGGHAIVTWLANPQATGYSVWLCTSCWRCQEVCPVGIDIYDLMMALRRQEPAPDGYRTTYEHVLASGLALEISQEEIDRVRADRGLEPAELPSAKIVAVLLGRGDPDPTV